MDEEPNEIPQGEELRSFLEVGRRFCACSRRSDDYALSKVAREMLTFKPRMIRWFEAVAENPQDIRRFFVRIERILDILIDAAGRRPGSQPRVVHVGPDIVSDLSCICELWYEIAICVEQHIDGISVGVRTKRDPLEAGGTSDATPDGGNESERAANRPDISHSADFTSVVFGDVTFTFSKGHQSNIVKALWAEWKKSPQHTLGQETLQAIVGSESTGFRVANVFRGHRAWGTMIYSPGKGVFAIRDPRNADP